jgi:hypothetical protein
MLFKAVVVKALSMLRFELLKLSTGLVVTAEILRMLSWLFLRGLNATLSIPLAVCLVPPMLPNLLTASPMLPKTPQMAVGVLTPSSVPLGLLPD